MDKQGHFEQGKWISPECEECGERYRMGYEAMERLNYASDALNSALLDCMQRKINRYEKMNLWQRLRWAITGKVQ